MTKRTERKISKDELLDLVNEKDEVIGTVWKSDAHKDPSKIHREVAIAVFNNQGEVLIQQRSLNKENDPGEWKITAAGHISAREKPEMAVERELYEELGIKIKPILFSKFFNKRVGKAGATESRFFYVYYAVVQGRPKIKLDKIELANAKWIKPKDLINFVKKSDWDMNGLSHKTIIELSEYLKL